jgi:uncharacterized membrane protein (DUF4010 family)
VHRAGAGGRPQPVTEFLEGLAVQLAVALGLGLLVGLQRQWVDDKPLGVRSFALITLTGALLGLFSVEHGPLLIGIGLVVVTVAVFTHSALLARERPVAGMTTELAAVVMYLVGAMTTSGWLTEAVVLGGIVTLLLYWKLPMHAWIKRIAPEEFQAVARFVLVSLVILPVLPNRTYGPYDVLNPFQIWLMVVFIVGLNLSGYFAMRMAGGRGGAVVGGVLGGLISSTATTVSFAGRSRAGAVAAPVAAAVILLASTVVHGRIVVEILAVAPTLLWSLLAPITVLTVLFVLVIGWLLLRLTDPGRQDLATRNPAELSMAVAFGAMYSVVTFASAAVSENFGERMLYPVAVLSGLTDVDAITLSTAHLYRESRVSADTAWRVVVVASLANLLFKAGVVAVLGGSALRRQALPAMVGLAAAGGLGVWLWP